MSISSVKQSTPRQQPELSNQDAVKSREVAQTSQASQVKGRVAEKQSAARSSQQNGGQSSGRSTLTSSQSTSGTDKTEQANSAQDARATQKAQQSLQQPGKRVDVLG